MKFSRAKLKPPALAVGIWVLILIIGYVLMNSLIMPMVAGKFKDVVEVPDLINKDPEKAKQTLRQTDLVFMLDTNAEHSFDVAAGKILSQFPKGGTHVKEGRRIWVKVSKGLQRVKMPAIKGKSLRQAEIMLQQAGLVPTKIKRIRHSQIPSGASVGTKPKAGKEVAYGSEVEIIISKGKYGNEESIPDLKGLSLAQAREKIEELDLKLGETTMKTDTLHLPGTVLSQKPLAGDKLDGQTLELVISQ